MDIAINNEFVAATAGTDRVAFIVNGDYRSAMGNRARAFAARLPFQIEIAYRSNQKIRSIFAFLLFLFRTRASITYIFDIGYSGVLAGAIYRIMFRGSLIVETGDAIVDLARSTGSRGRIGLWLTRLLETLSFRAADRIVVRGTFHKESLAQQGIEADVIQDGVDLFEFRPIDVGALRREYDLDNVTTVGLVGSSIWSEKLQICYGWELVEAIRLLKEKPIKGIMIGGGSGIPRLKSACAKYGIEDRVVFLDYVPLQELNKYLNLIDICLSTQTNDLAGNVRTTGKLPLYLAAGRYVLASNVGEASLVLDDEMLVDYEGVRDATYPKKLADRILSISQCPEYAALCGLRNVEIAKQNFDYRILAKTVRQTLAAVSPR
jgi:glycosyltransferase involved in cell wall biosynthesis